MNHLQLRCGSLHALNVFDLTYEILTNYGDTADVPKCINMLEDAHKKAQQSKILIPNVTLMVIATKFILQAQGFTLEMKQ